MSPRSPRRRRPLLCAAVAAAVLVSGTAATTVYVKAQAHDATALVSKVAAPSEGGTPTVDRDAQLAEAVADAVAGHDGEVSVAVLDVAGGASAAYASGDGTYDTASIVKVDVLAALLLRAQDEGRELTAQEKAYATTMIENSDNAATTALWDVIGRAAGLDAANRRLGLSGTSGGDGALWGLTQTTAQDQLTLLQQVFGVADDPVLSADSRAYVQGLMANVESDQTWGVSAAGDGDGSALKNGWLRRSTTGLWDINSVGRVTVGRADCLVAVVSNGSTTKEAGIALVEAVAAAAAAVVSGS
ncbi:class A beta-lactamase-related serine hydrolase [Streptomyces longispororuber]|uniref:class A beta-lactamase-related serine hydrolase n=1 Tax=Streptomyces longispororuber TaxID=68230 RepID=UPI00210D1DFC|nr:class A beta-lactamase-related serine hydrolase [Streptomyces longispororuber]MCQ4211590.1 class A beta-lactamase-related serine hydrolase [Streptomyces longispororuber]